MNKEYNIGDKVWYADTRTKLVEEKCQVCFGKLFVILVLGNGDEIQTPCEYCRKGYELPRGRREEYQWVAAPELVEIIRKDVRETPEGTEYSYGAKNHSLYMDRVFDSEAECLVRCTADQLEHEARETANKKSRKERNYESYAWHVGYHQKEAREHRKKAEYHDRRAILCKASTRKSRTDVPSPKLI